MVVKLCLRRVDRI